MRRPEKVVALAVAVLLTATAIGCTASNDGSVDSKAVAAVVGGVDVSESEVADRVAAMRTQNGLEDSTTWKEMLEGSGQTAEAIRQQQIMAIAQDITIRQAALAEGLAPNTASIDAQIARARGEADDAAWLSTLKQFGYSSEEQYRAELEIQDYAGQLRSLKTPARVAPEEELRAYVVANAPNYVGRRSSRIVLLKNDRLSEDALVAYAWGIRDKLLAGTEIGVAAAEYTRSTDSPTMNGDMGWDAMSGFNEAYQSALNSLSPGEVSGPVITEAGVVIIKCTDIYQIGENGVVYEEVPANLRQMLSDQLAVSNQERDYQRYLESLITDANIQINPMPEGLPYAI